MKNGWRFLCVASFFFLQKPNFDLVFYLYYYILFICLVIKYIYIGAL